MAIGCESPALLFGRHAVYCEQQDNTAKRRLLLPLKVKWKVRFRQKCCCDDLLLESEWPRNSDIGNDVRAYPGARWWSHSRGCEASTADNLSNS